MNEWRSPQLLYMWKFDREVLEREPGGPDLIADPAK